MIVRQTVAVSTSHGAGVVSFSVSDPSVWNSMSFDCRSAQLAISFRGSMLKEHRTVRHRIHWTLWLVSTIMCLRRICAIAISLIDWLIAALPFVACLLVLSNVNDRWPFDLWMVTMVSWYGGDTEKLSVWSKLGEGARVHLCFSMQVA